MINTGIVPRVFLEKTEEGEWFDEFVYLSRTILERRGFEIIPFVGKVNGYVNKHSDIIFASVQASEDFFDKCCINSPGYLGYPLSLKKYLHRNIERISIKDIETEPPFFIKPVDNIKEFAGELIESMESIEFMKKYMGVSDDTMVYLSEPIEFYSEYRCFVHNNEVKGIHFYQGDFKKYIDTDIVDQMVKDYTDSPIAYTLDVGVTDKGTTLIEVNDMWSIGIYGFNPKEYVNMCVDRMLEIKSNQ